MIAFVTPARAEDVNVETTSYWKTTAAVDALGIGMLVAGGVAEDEDGRDTTASTALFGVGALTALAGAPLVHLARGHAGRAGRGVLLRAGLGVGGMLLGSSLNPECSGISCDFRYAGTGMIIGLVIASIYDSAVHTSEPVKPPSWSPQVAATPGGVRLGAVWTW